MLQQRSKLLLLCLVAVILGLRLYDMSEEYLLRPIMEKRAQIEDLEADLILQRRLSERIKKAETDYKKWLTESLPGRQAEAATLYQNWLVDACEDASFEDVQVTPSSVEDLPLSNTALSFSVTGFTNYAGLQYFLGFVEATPLLHQVTDVDVRLAETEYDDRLDVQIGLQCMILDGADERSFLVDEETVAGIKNKVESMRRDSSDENPSPFLVIKEQPKPATEPENPVVMVAAEPVRPVVAPIPPKPDYSDKIVQVGTVLNENTREVWVLDERTNEQTVIKENARFEFYGIQGRVQSVTERYVVIEVDGKRYRWIMASSLKERESITRKKRTAS
ncbi:hypothetical protein N9D38_01685 [Rubripirellula sp.]|jgi:RNase P/RNase MRP subunit p29|nr:hypothetical protein [Rubripirellula sp.]